MQFSLSPRVANLDALINLVFSRLLKCKELNQNKSFALLRQLLYKFYWQTRFNLYLANPWKAFVQVSHAALAAKLGISREWVCKLINKKLKAERWIETYSPRRPDGKLREVTIFRPGAMLRQLLMSLLKSKQRSHNHVNDTSQPFSDSHAEKQKQTDRQTAEPIPDGWVDGTVQGIAKNWDMNKTIKW